MTGIEQITGGGGNLELKALETQTPVISNGRNKRSIQPNFIIEINMRCKSSERKGILKFAI